jgi:hypothetical protein
MSIHTASRAGTAGPAHDPKKVLASVFGDGFANNFQGALVVIPDQTIRSATAKRFFDKDFGYLSRQMYYEYQYRTWHGFNEEILDRYAAVIDTKLASIQLAQSNWLNRLHKILEQNGKVGEEAKAMFPSIVTYHVPVIASQARVYLDVLKQLDDVYTLASSAYLWGIIDSKQRSAQEWHCKKAVRAFRAVLQLEVIKLYREATRLQGEHRGQGSENPQMANIVEQQHKDIKSFEKAAAEEDRQDGNKPPADPGAIDPVGMLSQAVAGAQKKLRAPKKDKAAGDEAGPAAAPQAVAPMESVGT